MKGFGIYVKNDLLEPKHVKNMGLGIWVYMWFLDKMTSVGEDGYGSVLGGKPITFQEIYYDLGITKRSYLRWIKILEDHDYIKTKRAPYGLIILINKASKVFGRKNDKTRDKERERNNIKYKEWREAVLQRDNSTCQECNRSDLSLEVDHVRPFSTHPELRYDISNGMTLCKDCHLVKTKSQRKYINHTKRDAKDEYRYAKNVSQSDNIGTSNKTIQDNTIDNTNHNLAADAAKDLGIQKSSEGKQLNDLLYLFKPINPGYDNLFQNTTERKALQAMIDKYGLIKMQNLLTNLPQIVVKPYAPRITTPLQLQKRLGELVLFIKQEKSKGGGFVDAGHI